MKKFEKILERPWAAYTLATSAAVLLYVILNHMGAIKGVLNSIWDLISPVVIGIVIAYLLNPIAEFFENRVLKNIKKESARHGWAVVATLICFILFFAIILVSLIPSLAQSVSKLISNWNTYTQKSDEIIANITALAEKHNINFDLANISSMVDNSMQQAIIWIKNNSKSIFSTLGDVGTSVSNFVIGIVFGFCFLAAKKSLLRFVSVVRSAVMKEWRLEKNNELWKRCHKVFIRYVGCTLLDAAIVGFATLIFMLVMRMPFAPLIAIVVAITNIIPTFGPVIGGVIGIFFLILDSPLNALWFLIFICLIQAADGAIIKPRLFKGSLGIPGVWTLVLIIFGGKIAGIMGILLAIPFAAIFVILYKESIVPRLERRKSKINFKETEPETE